LISIFNQILIEKPLLLGVDIDQSQQRWLIQWDEHYAEKLTEFKDKGISKTILDFFYDRQHFINDFKVMKMSFEDFYRTKNRLGRE